MEGIGQFLKNISFGLHEKLLALGGGLSAVTVGYLLLGLTLLMVILVILLIIRGRQFAKVNATIDSHVDAVLDAKKEAQQTIDDRLKEQQQNESAMFEKINAHERESLKIIEEKEREFAKKTDEMLYLRMFYNRFKCVEDAEAECKQMLIEARDYVDETKARMDHEYLEIISHAQSEAGAIRDIAHGTMARSHQVLKKALNRSRELVDDAKREAGLPIEKLPDGVRKMLDDLSQMQAKNEAEMRALDPGDELTGVVDDDNDVLPAPHDVIVLPQDAPVEPEKEEASTEN